MPQLTCCSVLPIYHSPLDVNVEPKDDIYKRLLYFVVKFSIHPLLRSMATKVGAG